MLAVVVCLDSFVLILSTSADPPSSQLPRPTSISSATLCKYIVSGGNSTGGLDL
jgi:hypothetical protein